MGAILQNVSIDPTHIEFREISGKEICNRRSVC